MHLLGQVDSALARMWYKNRSSSIYSRFDLEGIYLLSFEQQDGAVTEVEVDEMLSFVSDKAAEISSHDAMPCRALSVIERLLDVLRNVLLNAELHHSLLRDFDGLILHLLGHVGRLDLSFQFLPGRLCASSLLCV